MIIVDDYANGIIKIGSSKYSFKNLTSVQQAIVEELPEYITEGNAYYYLDDYEDFYMFNISEDEVIKYLLDRDCLNYLEAC